MLFRSIAVLDDLGLLVFNDRPSTAAAAFADVIKFTDLPKPAQAKLLQRKESRANLANRLDLIGDDEAGLI